MAIFLAFFAAFHYDGSWDPTVTSWTSLGRGSSHTVALLAFAGFFYVLTLVIGFVLNRFAKFPGLNAINGALGAVVGLAKTCLFLWVLLLIALLFPLSPDLRRDLNHSVLARTITQPNAQVDETARRSFPWFTQPFANELLKRDHLRP